MPDEGVRRALEEAGIEVLDPELPLLMNGELKEAHLFVRRCVRQLWGTGLAERDRLKKDHHQFLVRGNAGIGKSMSLVCLLRVLLLRGETVVFEHRGRAAARAARRADRIAPERARSLRTGLLGGVKALTGTDDGVRSR